MQKTVVYITKNDPQDLTFVNDDTAKLVSVDSRNQYRLDKVVKQLQFLAPVYVIGGAVRDLLTNNKIKDVDVASANTPDVVAQMCKERGIKVLETGLQHGTVTLVLDGEMVEHTTFRKDTNADGRHSNVEYTDNLLEDMNRRDFTINAMAYSNGIVVDAFGGYEDYINGNLVTVGKAEDRFKEDYLRIIRALRFSARFDLNIDIDIINAIVKLAGNITNHVSKERVFQEFDSVCSYDKQAVLRFVQLFGACGVNLYQTVFMFHGNIYPILALAKLGLFTKDRMLYYMFKDMGESYKNYPLSTTVNKWVQHYQSNRGQKDYESFWKVRKHLVSTPDYYDVVVHENYSKFMELYNDEQLQEDLKNFPSNLKGKEVGEWQFKVWVRHLVRNDSF